MSYVDMAVGFGIFILFLAFILVQTINYFSSVPVVARISEFRDKATDFFESAFKSELTTEWDLAGMPAELELKLNMYEVIVTVKEPGDSARTNESVTVNVTFDEDCENKTWNSTVRVYDENGNEVTSWLSNVASCSGQYLKYADVIWKVNISANQTKKFSVYYSDDSGVSDPSYTSLVYDSDSWVPTAGDSSWTEAATDWTAYNGGSSSPTIDTNDKKVGDSSINTTRTFSSTNITLEYNPPSSITGVSNGWYLRAWLKVDDTTSLSDVKVAVSDGTSTPYKDILSDMSSNTWYLFEKELSSTVWTDNWGTFNASEGIDFVRFYITNSTPSLTRTLKIDDLRFEKKPLEVKEFPAKKIPAISSRKVKALRNYAYEQLKKGIGEDYKFVIEIANVTG